MQYSRSPRVLRRWLWPMLAGSVFTGVVFAQAPADLKGFVIRIHTQSVGGTPVIVDTVTVLDVDGTFGEIYRQSSTGATPLLPRNGTHMFTQTGADTGTLELTPTGEAPFTYTLSFSDAVSGTIAGGTAAGTFHLSPAALNNPLANTSQRGLVTDTVPGIIGFVVPPNQTVLVLARAVGPGLAAFSVPLTVLDPRISVYHDNTLIAQNNDWDDEPGNKATVTAAGSFTGAFPLNEGSTDAAIVLLLGAGNYTVQVSGAPGEDPAEILGELYVVP